MYSFKPDSDTMNMFENMFWRPTHKDGQKTLILDERAGPGSRQLLAGIVTGNRKQETELARTDMRSLRPLRAMKHLLQAKAAKKAESLLRDQQCPVMIASDFDRRLYIYRTEPNVG